VLYSVGVKDSHDLLRARKVAQLMRTDVHEILVDIGDVESGIVELYHRFGELTPVEFSFELPLLFVAREARERRICTGQGADELFGGYAKYLTAPDMMEADLKAVFERTLPREREIAGMHGKSLTVPYLSESVVDFSVNVPVDCKIRNGIRKWILREAARNLGVPEELVSFGKKAAQYGTGIWKLMRREARRRGMRVDRWSRWLVERD
jgi:asparagine synthase (glutamine-hydrolysing)